MPTTDTAAASKKTVASSTASKQRHQTGAKGGRKAAGKKTAGLSGAAAHQASQTQLKLWRETLDVLKKLETAQGRLAEQAAAKAAKLAEAAKAALAAKEAKEATAATAAKEANTAKTAAAGKGTQTEGQETATPPPAASSALILPMPGKRAAKRKAAAASVDAAAAAAAAKDAEEQVRLLTSALHLLKNVLSTQGPQGMSGLPGSELSKTSEPSVPPPTDNDVRASDAGEGKLGKAARKKLRRKAAAATDEASDTTATTAAAAAGETTSASTTAADSAGASSGPGGPATKTSKKKVVAAAASAASAPSAPSAPSASVASAASAASPAASTATAPKPFAYLTQPLRSPYRVCKVNARSLRFTAVEENVRPVPRLHYGLDRALFNPGVYHLQDPRSRVYNFDPYLSTIMPLREFDFNALKQYVTSSKDPTLIAMAAKHRKKYSGSTSSMTSLLSHFHFLLSGWRPINPAHTSRTFAPESLNFTRITRAPAATFLHWKDGTYAIDADKEFDTANILSMLGKSMEKLLTVSKADFEKYRVTKSHELTDAERNDPESFHYSTLGDFLMRSQLDAHDPRLPGSGMFDLKTRAVVSIRMDARDFRRGLGYEIRSRFGQYESFEREYFDMIRSAFLKYALQVRMGRMDGIYVAFHNTQRIFGFQYISVNEMDLALHGTDDRTLGDREFKLSLHLLNAVLDRATERFPGRSLRIHVETRPSDAAPFMYVFATPVTPAEISEVQDASKASVEAFERRILGIVETEEDDQEAALAAAQAADAADAADAAAQAATAAAIAADGSSTAVDERDAVAAPRRGKEGREEEDEEDEEEEEEDDDDCEDDGFDVWETMRQKVEETMENEAQGIESVRDTIEDALEQSGLLRGRSPDETKGYVNALLEAITRPDTEVVAETILKEQEADEDAETDVDEDVELEAEAEADDEAKDAHPAQTAAVEDVEAVEVVEAAEVAEDIEATEAIEADVTADAAEVEDAAVTGARVADDADAAAAAPSHDADSSAESDSATTEATADVQDSPARETPTEGDEPSIVEADTEAEAEVRIASPSPTTPVTSLSDTISLKDLIMKLAAQVEAAQVRDAAEEPSSDKDAAPVDAAAMADATEAAVDYVDAPKNKRFERILSEMMARASKESKRPDDKAKPASSNSSSDDTKNSSTSVSSSSTSSTSSSSTSSAMPSTPASSTPAAASDTASDSGEAAPPPEVMGMIVTIRNKVNGQYVMRPEKLTRSDSWTVEYAIEEILPEKRAQSIYAMMKRRRKLLLVKNNDNQAGDGNGGGGDSSGGSSKPAGSSSSAAKAAAFNRDYLAKLYALSAKGRRFRRAENEYARRRPVQVYGEDKPLQWSEVFDTPAEAEDAEPSEAEKTMAEKTGADRKDADKTDA